MPMVLRPRRSIRPGQVGEVELRDGARRSTRLQGSAAANEESDESDSETVRSPAVMEIHAGARAEPEEEAAVEADLAVTDLKDCSVVLDRIHDDDGFGKKEIEEREDMNRKGGKPASRIPTFHKRPPGLSPEVTVSKRETLVHVALPPERAATFSVEVSKTKTVETREATLPQPSIRVPRMGFEVSSASGGSEREAATAYSSLITQPKSWSLSESVRGPLMTVSPRPALRLERGSEGDQSESSANEADVIPDVPPSHLPQEGSLSHRLWEEITERREAALKYGITTSASGDSDRATEACSTGPLAQVEAIIDEEPPWESEPATAADPKDSRSSSDAEQEEELGGEESEGQESEEETERDQEPLISKTRSSHLREEEVDGDEPQSSVATENPTEVRSAKSKERSGCFSFGLCFLLPTALLLLGGVGLHVWHYGLPMSVAQLTAQLELHWLEGIGLLPEPCSSDCRVHLVESIPAGLDESSPSTPRIADSWLHLLHRANSSVDIAAFYFTLRDSDLKLDESSDAKGREVFEQLKELDSRGVKLQIAVNSPQKSTQDTEELAAAGAEVREVDLQAVTGGIVHTKLWVVDQKHLYLGSANMDWRSLSEVKEVGLSVEDCSCLAQDASRIFGVYWSLGGMSDSSLPPYWPARLSALSSAESPMSLKFNGVPARVYMSSAPPQISARGRSDDLSAILSVIDDARKFVYISVMDFLPLSQFTQPLRFWPAIDSALRAAACARGVQVRLMVSCWEHSPASMFTFLQSLLVLNRRPLHCDIDVKIFTVPSTAEQKQIPFARVNHAKYMVTDRALYIGTSNWSENYFTQTAGVGLVVNQTGSDVGPGQQTLQSQAEALFLRDWSSAYSSALSVDGVDVCPGAS